MVMVSPSQLRQIIPGAGERADLYAVPISAAAVRFEINSPPRLSAFLAQIGHESGSLADLVEDLKYSAAGLRAVWPSHFSPTEAADYARQPERIANRVYADRMGNGDEASGDGWSFRGRGLIQITGRANYKACSEGIGLDLIYAPDQLIRAEPAAQSAAWFWKANGLNALADAGDFDTITKRINGGLTGLADRLAFWTRAKNVLGAA
jgi:putative chitinase